MTLLPTAPIFALLQPGTVVIPPGVTGTALTAGPAAVGFVTGKIVKMATPEGTHPGFRVLAGAGTGAAMGAALGSVIPGVGTLVGAGIGAVFGAIGAWAA